MEGLPVLIKCGLALSVVAIPQIMYGMGLAYVFWWPWLG
jgi:hypothetical protein